MPTAKGTDYDRMTLPKAFWFLWTGQMFSRIGTLAPAFLVLYLQQSDLAGTHTTPVIVGLFGSGVVLSGLIGGALADAFGARRTILFAQPAAVVTALLFVPATNIVAIGVLCLLAGFLSGVDRPAAAGLIAELVPRDQFSRAYSLYLVGFNIGMSLAPVFAGLLLAWHPLGLFFVWAASCVVYAALVRTLRAEAARPAQEKGAALVKRAAAGIAEPFRTPALAAFLVLCFLLACIYLQVNSTLPLNMRDEGLSPQRIGVVLAVNAVLAIVLLPWSPRAVKELRPETPLVLAAALFAVGFGLNAFAHGIGMFVVAVFVWTAGEVLWAPMSANYLALRAPAGRTGTYQGAYFFAWNAAFVVGGPLGVTVADAYGYGALWIGTFALGGAAALGFALAVRVLGAAPDPEATSEPEKTPEPEAAPKPKAAGEPATHLRHARQPVRDSGHSDISES
jgi:MFS family permease